MSKNILLLGGVLPVLHFLRRIQKFSNNIHIIAGANDVAVSSKYGVSNTYGGVLTPSQVIHRWISENSKDPDGWVVIPCSEFFLAYVGMFRQSGYKVFAPSEETLSIFSDKKKFYSWLNEIGIFTGEWYSLGQTLDFTENKKYIVKASRSILDSRIGFKTAVVSDDFELREVVGSIPKKYHDDYIIQRILSGSVSLSYGGVWEGGKELAGIVVKQIRQYPRGVTSAALIHDEQADTYYIKSVIQKISEQKKLTGFIELEFIKNEMGIIPIDLNPRLWGWSSFLFENYSGLAENIVNGRWVCAERTRVDSWSNVWRDFPAILREDCALSEKVKNIHSLAKVEHMEFICWKDIKPEFLFLVKGRG